MLELYDCPINANIRDTASFLRDIYKGELDFLLSTCEQILHINMPSTRHDALRNTV
jgi:hypothetical protein